MCVCVFLFVCLFVSVGGGPSLGFEGKPTGPSRNFGGLPRFKTNPAVIVACFIFVLTFALTLSFLRTPPPTGKSPPFPHSWPLMEASLLLFAHL